MNQNKMNFDSITIIKNTRPNEETYTQAFGRFLGAYEWDWACSLTFRDQVSKPYMKRSFWEWKKRICKDEHMQVGYCLVLCENPHSHIHALMLGANRFGRTLAEVDKMKWKRVWIQNNGNKKPLSMLANQIESVSSSFAYGAYMGRNAQVNAFDIEISKPRFLRKFRR